MPDPPASANPDHFASCITARYVVALLSPTIIEYSDNTLAQQYARGLYTFTNKKLARRFTTLCNEQGLDDPVAFLFINPHNPEPQDAAQDKEANND